jgi:tRNA-splicing ligase RtcB (3'-phosphate/5'-hydroxy nucleic acid ligase)
MRVPAVIYGGESLVRDMDEKVSEQLKNVAALTGIVRAAYAMPDAHWGYGFPVGGSLCGSLGLGNQIGTEFMREMAAAAETSGWPLPDRESISG